MEWIDIPGFEGLYQVSDAGLIRSLDRVIDSRKGDLIYQRTVLGRPIKPNMGTDGYRYIRLHKVGQKSVRMKFAAAVLLAFVGPRPIGMYACHNDGNKLNDSLTNLRYDTPKSNSRDSMLHDVLPWGERAKFSKLSYMEAFQIKGMFAEGVPVKKISPIFDTTISNLYYMKKGHTWNREMFLRLASPSPLERLDLLAERINELAED